MHRNDTPELAVKINCNDQYLIEFDDRDIFSEIKYTIASNGFQDETHKRCYYSKLTLENGKLQVKEKIRPLTAMEIITPYKAAATS